MWLHIPLECSPCAADTADSTSPSDSYFQALSQFATSSAKFHAPAYWRREWKTGRLTPLRSGMTSAPSTEPDGLDAWILSWRDFPANPTPSQESERVQPMLGGRFGMTSSASRGSVQLELFSLRTFPDCSQVQTANPCAESTETYDLSALVAELGGGELTTLVARLSARVSSSWRRPTATDCLGSSNNGQRKGTNASQVRLYCQSTGGCGHLTHVPSPVFIEWLMGLPPGWTFT